MANDNPPFELLEKQFSTEESIREQRKAQLASRTLPAFRDHLSAAKRYKPSEALRLVINMALHTGAPLLLTGEPGTGKTQAAAYIAEYFNINYYPFYVRSTSVARDLLYEFDAVGYLHWAQSGQRDGADHSMSSEQPAEEGSQSVRKKYLEPQALWRAYEDKHDSVVLIDEIDKAPRDFPNDLLLELDQHKFAHPFDANHFIEPASGRQPIIVITSNDERRLPDAFLRRCIFHHIDLTDTIVRNAVESMAEGEEGGGFPNLDQAALDVAQEKFLALRDLEPPLSKLPATAELLAWLSVLSVREINAETLRRQPLGELDSLGMLIKNAEDLKRLRG